MSDVLNIEVITNDLMNATTSEAYNAILKSARASGWTLQQLGDATGVTREAIRLRLLREVDPALLRTYPAPEKATARAARLSARRLNAKARRRILGVKVTSPVMNVPVETLNRLAELHALVTRVRGTTPLDAAEREAIKPYGDLLWATITEFEIPQTHLEAVCGLSPNNFTSWLRRHGYLENHPSQKSYRGIYRKPSGAKRTLVPGGTCRRGHALSEANIVRNGKNWTCGSCLQLSRARAKARREVSR